MSNGKDQQTIFIQNPDSAMPSLIEHWRQRRTNVGTGSVVLPALQISATGHVYPASTIPPPDVLLQATVLHLGNQVDEGELVAGVSVAWFEVIAQLDRDPEFLFKIPWRKLEEIIAGAYERAGWEVVLTHRSGDGGRDVIATRIDMGSIRILDQIKAYKQGHLVTADEVRSMLGVLEAEKNASKGLVTTTSSFAPGIEKDPRLSAFMPYRLELKDGQRLRTWLSELGSGKSPAK